VTRVVVDDLASLAADAIVRPATARLEPTTPVVRRLDRIGGGPFARQLTVQKELAVGAAVVTGGGDLPAEFVIHAIIRSDAEPVSREAVARAWLSALQRSREWGFAYLTAPPLGTGAGNLTPEAAAEIMVTVLAAHTAQSGFPPEVCFVVETEGERDAFEGALRRQAAGRS
jgi:O-acetyl-ADP-ribose deacetylase